MRSKGFWLVAQIGVLLVISMGALAQAPTQAKLSGLFNDYTPATSGAWEVRGEWSLRVKGDSGTADFSAALTMGLSTPTARNAHTHHITLVDGVVTSLTNGFRVTGTATITGNGSYPPPFGGSSTVQIDITGGNTVAYSNIKLTFGGDAVAHFGPQPVNGVVRTVKQPESHED
ncbi:MAG: hypothetical protein JWN74_3032 [Acidobacteriaceae bacterium]|jgi:hypothetical protein|nr:hypothetical protein [Acidobacteriaceae bacterium]